jgi:hypothetical protein
MKQVVISNLKLELEEEEKYDSYFYKDEEVICSKFIKDFFGFTKVPKKIKKLYFVRNNNGLFELFKDTGIFHFWGAVLWNCGLSKSYDDDNFYEGYFNMTSELSDRLLKLFKNDETKIKIDVYIEGWK